MKQTKTKKKPQPPKPAEKPPYIKYHREERDENNRLCHYDNQDHRHYDSQTTQIIPAVGWYAVLQKDEKGKSCKVPVACFALTEVYDRLGMVQHRYIMPQMVFIGSTEPEEYDHADYALAYLPHDEGGLYVNEGLYQRLFPRS